MTAITLPPRDPSRLPDFIAQMDPDGAGKLCLFDADGTLWVDDVADDFCAWMIAEGHVSTGDRWPTYLQIYRDDHAAGCRYMLSFYEGLRRGALKDYVSQWWGLEARRWVIESLEAIYWLDAHGYELWIVTGSPTDTMHPLIGALPFTRVLGMDFALHADGTITGELDGISCADEGKADAVRAAWGPISARSPVSLGAGNGSLDAAMIALADVNWAVYPNAAFESEARTRGWHILPRPAGFVEEAKLA
jgi:phosphoserine phosphatase